jgi:hypothetical protein
MGSNLAFELANSNLDLETALAHHLRGNHYPPVPLSMVEPCIQAIDAFYDEDYNRLIELPEGISWRNKKFAPANEIVDAHHLNCFIDLED